MFERFTHEARAVVLTAIEESHQLGHEVVDTEHLLLGLLAGGPGGTGVLLREAGVDAGAVREALRQPAGAPPLSAEDAEALAAIGIDVERVLRRLEAMLERQAPAPATPARRRFFARWRGGSRHLPFTFGAKKTLELSLREAIHLKHRHIGSEHLLLALLRVDHGRATTVLTDLGVDLAALRTAALRSLDRAA